MLIRFNITEKDASKYPNASKLIRSSVWGKGAAIFGLVEYALQSLEIYPDDRESVKALDTILTRIAGTKK